MYLVSDLLQNVERKIHGQTLDRLQSPLSLVNEASRNIIASVDPKETIRTTQIDSLFTDVTRYPLPSDLKGDKVIDLIPQTIRFYDDYFNHIPNDLFSRGVTDHSISVEYDNAEKFLHVNSRNIPQGVLLNPFSRIDEGSWGVSDGGLNLRRDSIYNRYYGSSVAFDTMQGDNVVTVTTTQTNKVD